MNARMCKSREQFAPRRGDPAYSHTDFSLNLFEELSDVFKHGRARRRQNAEQVAHKTKGGAFVNTVIVTERRLR